MWMDSCPFRGRREAPSLWPATNGSYLREDPFRRAKDVGSGYGGGSERHLLRLYLDNWLVHSSVG